MCILWNSSFRFISGSFWVGYSSGLEGGFSPSKSGITELKGECYSSSYCFFLVSFSLFFLLWLLSKTSLTCFLISADDSQALYLLMWLAVDAFQNQWRKENEEMKQRRKKNQQKRRRRCTWQNVSKRECKTESSVGVKVMIKSWVRQTLCRPFFLRVESLCRIM